MHIQLEATENTSIEAYSDHEVRINNQVYSHNLLVSRAGIITNWSIDSIDKLTPETLDSLMTKSIDSQPEIILIGHNGLSKLPPPTTSDYLSKQRIALESMSIGAACRTYNVLLSEHRNIVLGIIF